jgi:hypothetical protein
MVNPDLSPPRQLRAQAATVPDHLLAHVAPLGSAHIGLTGDYVWTEVNPVVLFRPLPKVRSMRPSPEPRERGSRQHQTRSIRHE